MFFRNGSHEQLFRNVRGFGGGHSAQIKVKVRGSHVSIANVDFASGTKVPNGADPWMWSADVRVKKLRDKLSQSFEIKTPSVTLSRMEIRGGKVTNKPFGVQIGTGFMDEELSTGDRVAIKDALNEIGARADFYDGFTPTQQRQIYYAFQSLHAKPPRPEHVTDSSTVRAQR
jgi:hypothetical protein